MNNFKKRKRLIFVSIVFVYLIFLFLNELTIKKSMLVAPLTNLTGPSLKYILYWTPFFDRKDFCIGFGSEPFKSCEYKNCFSTDNRFLIPEELFDAILFHATYSKLEHGTPRKRRKQQKYIFMNLESPLHTTDLKQYNSFYNWTMTYRSDSDVFRPYSYILQNETDYVLPSVDSVMKRDKLVAWFVSNCNSKSGRENFTRELQEYLPVDIYGDCGQYKCAKQVTDYKQSSEECYEMIENNYLFYLSLENSLCKDYVTEKMYNVLKRNIVPVVYGGANYTQIAPPYSVINVNDFDSVKDLANYLIYLSKNINEYMKYFEWKRNYYVETSNQLSSCELCRKLNVDQSDKVYVDLNAWWWGPEKRYCKKPPLTFYKEH
ncbi:alpha-(1,3)-fucosyltransferase C-like [Agrilus planipennis]|uniref:Fucosyltransferase n=1 Tax=Agrilus planipennis TaxID=224129 RepID=A0A1W4XJW0_AGRPL|nr:alpha-(1,3)-fucosyltransferase C-like [Agrilus planipennis]